VGVTALAGMLDVEVRPRAVRLEDLGELVPVSRVGGQGRVYRPAFAPASLGPDPVVVKIYRRAPPAGAAHVLAEMVAWGRSLALDQRARLHAIAAWPLAVVHAGPRAAGIVMRDVNGRFAVPFVMPSGRRERVLLTLEHLLGADGYLELRGLGVRLDTTRRAQVAERVSAELAFLHRHGIAASDIAPNNLLVAFGRATEVCFIDCDSMGFRGRSALTCVQTADWDLPSAFDEPSDTRAGDAYKLGLVILRLFARSHDARAPAPHLRYVPVELRDLLYRSLGENAVNRPAAGEWQRALRGLLADGGLDQRYPGPAPAPRLTPAATPNTGAYPSPRVAAVRRLASGSVGPAAVGAAAVGAAAARAAGARPAAGHPAPGRPISSAVSPAAGLWLRRTVVALWIVAGTAVLLVVLSRLFAAAVPVPDSGGGASAGSGADPSPYYYYNPGYYPGGRGGQGGPTGIIQVP
jgi:eukaryotic-like serine/threonine-protein kinase